MEERAFPILTFRGIKSVTTFSTNMLGQCVQLILTGKYAKDKVKEDLSLEFSAIRGLNLFII